MSDTWCLRSARVLVSDASGAAHERPACVVVCDERIAAILPWSEAPTDVSCMDVGGAVVLPGAVDTHVHVNEPGRTEWEGFATATRAAAAGGITTLVDMPLNSLPPTTTAVNLRRKVDAAAGQCAVDHGFWGGVIPGNLADLPALCELGVFGCKAFLCDSGVPEFPAANAHVLRAAMHVLAAYDVPLLAHAELCSEPVPWQGDPRSYAAYLASRPARWEVDAIQLLVTLARETRCAVHVVHLSAAEALPVLRQARAEGVPITVETCPHYLWFAAEDIDAGATAFKCAPPIRGRANREQLWEGLREDVVDFVVSDHSPCTPCLKCTETGNFEKAWGGIAGLQFQRSLVWTALRSRGMDLPHLVAWQSARPAAFLRLPQKGRIAVGCDADLVVFDPDAPCAIAPDTTWHRHPLTPYAGANVTGVVSTTLLRGRLIYREGEFAHADSGRPVWRTARSR